MSNARRLTGRLVMTFVLLAVGVLVMNLPILLRHRRPVITVLVDGTLVDSVTVPAGMPAPDSAAVSAALERVMDPELDLSLVALGLVHELRVDSTGNVRVVLALTTPECPLVGVLGNQVMREMKKVAGVRRIEVKFDPRLEWNPGQLSPAAREKFRRMFGDDSGTGR